MAFFRQIPYITNWSYRDVNRFLYKFDKTKVHPRGKVLAAEGSEADTVFVVREGEVEVVKTNLNNVLFNKKTAVVGLQEVRTDAQKKKARMLKSTDWLEEPANKEQADIGAL